MTAICAECRQPFDARPPFPGATFPPKRCAECRRARRERMVTLEGVVTRRPKPDLTFVEGPDGGEYLAPDVEDLAIGVKVTFTSDPFERGRGRTPLARNVEVI